MSKAQGISLLGRAPYNAIWLAKHILGNERAARWLGGIERKLDLRLRDRMDDRAPARFEPVEERSEISDRELYEQYIRGNRPVVLRGFAKHWPAVQKWCPQFIAENFGDEMTHAMVKPFDTDSFTAPHRTTQRELLEAVDEGIPIFSPFNDLINNHPELRSDFDVDWLRRMRHKGPTFAEAFELFIGGPNTRTPLHCAWDSNLYVQVWGTKHWLIWPANYSCFFRPKATRGLYSESRCDYRKKNFDDYPAGEFAHGMETTLEPGDVLFNVSGFWHDVQNCTSSIAVGYRWVAPANAWVCPMMHLLTLLATDPSVFRGSTYSYAENIGRSIESLPELDLSAIRRSMQNEQFQWAPTHRLAG